MCCIHIFGTDYNTSLTARFSYYICFSVNPSCSIDNGLCSSFCFPSPIGRTCGCKDGDNLQSNQITCEEGL